MEYKYLGFTPICDSIFAFFVTKCESKCTTYARACDTQIFYNFAFMWYPNVVLNMVFMSLYVIPKYIILTPKCVPKYVGFGLKCEAKYGVFVTEYDTQICYLNAQICYQIWY